MAETNIKYLVDRYIAVSQSVEKKAGALVKEQIGSDLTNDQHFTLRYMNQVGTCTSSELAEIFDVQKSAITAIIQRLWEKGLIERTRDEKDRRVVYLSLTDKGKDLYSQCEERIHSLVEGLITQFEQHEIEQFIHTFEKLNQLLINYKMEE
jgi:DNA-binding MarR family transcriptional regulator